MKTSTIKKEAVKDRKGLYTFLSFLMLLAIWKLASLALNSEVILPSPEKTLIKLFELGTTRDFYLILFSSIGRGLLGFFISFILGTIFGFLAGFNRIFARLFEPFLAIIRSTPVIAVILIALIWFRATNVPVFASFLMSFPIIVTNTMEGIKNTDEKLVQMANVYRIKRSRILKEIYLPSLSPFLLAAVSSAFGIGWKVVIAAEVLSQPEYAIGTSMQLSRIYLNMDEVFAWTIVAVITGYLFERILRIFAKKTSKWKN